MNNAALLLASSLVLAYFSSVVTTPGPLDSEGYCEGTEHYFADCNKCVCVIGMKPVCSNYPCYAIRSTTTSTTPPTTSTTPPTTSTAPSTTTSTSTTTTTTTTPPPTCTVPICSDEETCPTLYEPVCGIKVEFKTFDNECTLGGEGCEEGYRYFSDGECQAASLETQSTSNSGPTKDDAVNCEGICVMKGYFNDDCNTCKCIIGYPPKCTHFRCPPKEPPCIIPTCSSNTTCSKYDEPVCGINVELRTFSNECVLGGQGCEEGFRYFKDGEC